MKDRLIQIAINTVGKVAPLLAIEMQRYLNPINQNTHSFVERAPGIIDVVAPKDIVDVANISVDMRTVQEAINDIENRFDGFDILQSGAELHSAPANFDRLSPDALALGIEGELEIEEMEISGEIETIELYEMYEKSVEPVIEPVVEEEIVKMIRLDLASRQDIEKMSMAETGRFVLNSNQFSIADEEVTLEELEGIVELGEDISQEGIQAISLEESMMLQAEEIDYNLESQMLTSAY